MLGTIAVILIVLWILGLVSSYTMGGFIHILLVVLERVMHEPPDHPGGGYGVHKLKLRRLNNNLKSINTMKPNAYIGIILIILAVISFAYQGITYQTREKAVDLGPLQVTAERTHTIPLPPILGFIALAGGVVLLVTSNKQT